MAWIRKDSWPAVVHCPRRCTQWSARRYHSETWCWCSGEVRSAYPSLFVHCCVGRIVFFALALRKLACRSPGRLEHMQPGTFPPAQKPKDWIGFVDLLMEEGLT